MSPDEQAIRDLVDLWMKASQSGDTQTVLSLMSDDVVFTVPGREPFGKAAFAAASAGAKGMRIEGTSEIVEVKVLGDWAWMRNKLRIQVTMPDQKVVVRSGYTLTILKKEHGKWVVTRDANLLTVEGQKQ